MGSVLAPVSDPAYKEGHLDWYGAVELDADTGEEVWRFDAAASGLDVCRYYQHGDVVRQRGFRPSSVQRLDDGRTLIAGYSRGVVVDEDGDIRTTFTHELLNDLHEVQRTPAENYLLASTGMDTLLLLDGEFEELWRWHMWEHLDDATRPTGYYPDDVWHTDTREMAMSPDDRYHLNYATVLEDGAATGGDRRLLCSALNYGVFTVDIATGAVVGEYTGLEECHNPRRLDGEYAVAESGRDRVVVVDFDGGQRTLFEGGLDHVKDADPVDDGGTWLLADNKNHRVLLWDEGDPEPSRTFDLGEGAYPYEADYLTGSDSFA
jgi:hypothetical protein